MSKKCEHTGEDFVRLRVGEDLQEGSVTLRQDFCCKEHFPVAYLELGLTREIAMNVAKELLMAADGVQRNGLVACAPPGRVSN